MDPQLVLFRRQYLQLFEPDFLAWPPKSLLRDSGVQQWLYKHCFDTDSNPHLPSDRYRLRVLKPLVRKVEQAIEDPEEDVGYLMSRNHLNSFRCFSLFFFKHPRISRIDSSLSSQEISDDLMSCLSTLMSSELPSETTAVQQKSYVTFTTLPENLSREDEEADDPTMTLLERRQLISGSLTTGYRTWEAALHLGAYFLSGQGQELIKGKSILELGAGTGFLAILCAKNLGAAHVTTTDGDEGVVEALKENLFLNGLDDERKVLTSVLRWGHGVRGSWVQDDFEEHPYDTVIGADIVSAFRDLIIAMIH
jgi:predicted nicotinamide N-methyase